MPLTGKSWLNRELLEIAYGRLQHMDLPLRDVDDAWDRLQRLRTVYGVQLQSLIDYLVAPADVAIDPAIPSQLALAGFRARRWQFWRWTLPRRPRTPDGSPG